MLTLFSLLFLSSPQCRTSRASALQLNRQTKMQKILNELSPKVDALDPKATLSATLSHLRNIFPGCQIIYGHHPHRKIKLSGVAEAVPFADFKNGVWENDELIDRFIREKNHLEWNADINNEVVRALAANVEDHHYLVVESTDLKRTFANQAEVMFVQSCALAIGNSQHYARLEEAIQAKASFLRDVQHSIRTNLNGILSASEMLLDEQAQRSSEHWVRQQANLYYSPAHSPPQKEASRPAFNRTISQVSDLTSEYSHTSSSASTSSTEGLLTIVDSSGRNLLQVINGLLRLDQTNQQDLKPEKQICNIYDIEEDIIENTMLGTPRAKFFKVTLLTEDKIQSDNANIYTDSKFLIQALSPVVQNAVDFSEEGIVLLTFDISETGSLVVDVENDGPPIPKVSFGVDGDLPITYS
jgi:signal transduction histidine kinase